MDNFDILNDVLENKILSQSFYNDAAIQVRNPVVRQMFIKFRDEEMKHIEVVQKEIVAIENKPYSVTRILAKLKG